MKINKPKVSVIAGVGIGIVAAVVISVLLTALYGALMMNGSVGETPSTVAIFLIRAVSVTVGCFLATILTKEYFLPVIGITAAGYLIVLLGTGIAVFDGSFKNFGSGLVSVLLGGVIPGITKLKAPKKRRKMPKFR